MEFDPYATLRLQPGASPEEIRRQYRKLALQTHPDKVGPDEREQASQRFQEVARAYEILSDPGKRRAWDTHRSTEGMPFEDPMDLFRSVWEALEESGFLHSVHVPTVPPDLFANPEAKIAMRILHVMPAVPFEGLPRMEEVLPAWVARHVPAAAAAGPASEWVQRQGRTLGQWADAFLQRRSKDAPGQALRRILVRAPLADVWTGARKRLRYERRRGGEKATCVIPLRLPGLVLEGAGDDGGDLEVFVEPIVSEEGPWSVVAGAHDLGCVVPTPDLTGLWERGGVVRVPMPNGAPRAVHIPAGVPTQRWRVPHLGFPRGDSVEGEDRGDLLLFLVPGQCAEVRSASEAEAEAEPILPDGIQKSMFTTSCRSSSAPSS